MIPPKLHQQSDLGFVIRAWFQIRGEISYSMVFVTFVVVEFIQD
jgi:hypothetical protein